MRPVAVLGTALLAVAWAFPVTTATAATAQPTDPAAEVAVTSMAPAVPTPGTVLTLSGTVTNPTDTPYDDVQVQLRLSARLTGRSEITAVVAGKEIEKASSIVRGSLVDVAPGLDPGATLSWTVAVDVDALGLRTAGVHGLTTELLARTEGSRRADIIAIARCSCTGKAAGQHADARCRCVAAAPGRPAVDPTGVRRRRLVTDWRRPACGGCSPPSTTRGSLVIDPTSRTVAAWPTRRLPRRARRPVSDRPAAARRAAPAGADNHRPGRGAKLGATTPTRI